ncbi:MAG: hypothetical protein HKN41_12295 [Ilumatobacter sp.]|nr:hypothetical protein [Ilumatobacter sp.]
MAIGLAAGVVGLSLGWMLGGSSGGSDEANPQDGAPATASSVPEESAEPVDEDDDALTPLEPVAPPTTARRTTTTSTIAPPETEPVILNEKLTGSDFRIVGVTRGTTTVEIDVATSTMTTQRWPGLNQTFTPVLGDGWLVTTSSTSGAMRLITADGTESSPPIGEPWNLLWVEGTDTFWRGVESGFAGGFDRYELVDLSGRPLGPVIDARGTWPAGVDPAGGVLTIDQGRTYSLREGGVEFVGPGELLGISAEYAVLRICDEQLACDLLVVDRVTGEQRPLGVEPDVAPTSPWFFGPSTGSVAPGGGAVSFLAPTERGVRLVVIDLDTAEVYELVADTGGPSGFAWSPDGRFGAFVQGSTPQLFDRETGSVEPLAEGLGAWGAIDVRPPRP